MCNDTHSNTLTMEDSPLSPLLTAIVWVLSLIANPFDDIPPIPPIPPIPTRTPTSHLRIDTAIAKSLTEMDDLYEIRRRRLVHSSTSMQHWWTNYGTESQSPSPPTIMWANDVSQPLTKVASLTDMDTVLFKDTTPPVSYYASPNIKGVLKNKN